METEVLFNREANEWIHRVNKSSLPKHVERRGAPWMVRNIEQERIINKILRHSLEVQSSSINGVYKFHGWILSNACLNVSCLLHYYLQYFNVKSDVHCGGIRVRVSDDHDGIVHVFLSIDGQIIDNTYIHATEGRVTSQESFEKFFNIFSSMKRVEKYDKDPPSRSSIKFHSDSESAPEFEFQEVSCRSELNMKKALAQALSDRNLGLGTHVYDKLMRLYIREEFGVEIPSIVEEMARVCWNCGESFSQAQLKSCKGCKIAKYCSRDCQVTDWRNGHKIMHKIIKRGNDSILSRTT